MWPFTKKHPDLFFTNTLSGKKELFIPQKPSSVSLYSCGPTVYGPVQIGNLRSFVLADLVARVLLQNGYRVKRVMNITDVGHLVADAELGEDKMAVGAKREQTTPEAIAKRYTDLFLENIRDLNIDISHISFPRATEYLTQQIRMITLLERKGFTYMTPDGVYFDTTKFPEYGQLGNIRDAELEAGARVAIGEKKNSHDFVLWRKAKPHDLQKWNSPWGEGNPGWSIECSAMATELLGKTIDIHTGGEDLAAVHHNNEIAQSQCSSGERPFVHYWLHGAFLTIGGEKLSKSAGNSFTLADVSERGLHPLALRYLFLQAHYRTPLSFSWESLTAAQETLVRLWNTAQKIKKEAQGRKQSSDIGELMTKALRDDLGTPQALASLQEGLGSTLSAPQKWQLLIDADTVLGLLLTNPPVGVRPEDEAMAKERDEARKQKDYATSDRLRTEFENRGYRVYDSGETAVYIQTRER